MFPQPKQDEEQQIIRKQMMPTVPTGSHSCEFNASNQSGTCSLVFYYYEQVLHKFTFVVSMEFTIFYSNFV
jgi:hypothetical protein